MSLYIIVIHDPICLILCISLNTKNLGITTSMAPSVLFQGDKVWKSDPCVHLLKIPPFCTWQPFHLLKRSPSSNNSVLLRRNRKLRFTCNHHLSLLETSLPGHNSQTPTCATGMMTSSNGSIFRVTVHLCGEFTGPRWIPRTKASDAGFGVFFDMRPNKRLSKQWWDWWFETPSSPLWRHCNGVIGQCVI